MGKKRTYADTEDTGVFNDTEPGAEDAAEAAKAKGNNKYRRDKPWDHDGIDHWCVATLLRPRKHSEPTACYRLVVP